MSANPPPTVPEALLRSAARDVGCYVFHLDEGPIELPCAELAQRADLGARRLLALGVEPGDTVGLLGPNRPEWVAWAFSIWAAGAILVPIQIPIRVRDPTAFAEQLARLVDTARCRHVIADPRFVPLLPAGVASGWDDLSGASGDDPVQPTGGDAAVIQFTSGSTAEPKGALLTHAAVLAQMEILRDGYHHRDGTPRTTLSWTPFFHDLGLFANTVLPATFGSVSHHLPTDRFARDPAEWLRLVGSTRAALTVGPSSAFGAAVRAAGRRGESMDLGSLEVAFFAAEGVDPEIASRIVDRAQAFSLPLDALGSTYGLAEAVMAVAYTRVGSGLAIDRVSLEELTREGVACPAESGATRAIVSCGPPRMDLRISGADGDLPERHVGEVLVRGESLMSGYAAAGAPDPFVEGWLRTGDLGYMADGELYVTGRAKDVVIAMGHNYYPEDFEWAAARHPGVRPGRCVAFSKSGTEEVVVLVEPLPNEDRSLASEVKATVARAIGVAPREVVVLPPGTIEKTTSGKLRRAAMREAYGGDAPADG